MKMESFHEKQPQPHPVLGPKLVLEHVTTCPAYSAWLETIPWCRKEFILPLPIISYNYRRYKLQLNQKSTHYRYEISYAHKPTSNNAQNNMRLRFPRHRCL
uniref:Uncharacterized protein n=1 Tax=Cacopsylla melanoneura TaxID=428564 RepID=A0A8D8QNH2_9HEMI